MERHDSNHFPGEPGAVSIVEKVYLCFVSRMKGTHCEFQALLSLNRIDNGRGWGIPSPAYYTVHTCSSGRLGNAPLVFLAGFSSVLCHQRLGFPAGLSQGIMAVNPVAGGCGLLHMFDRCQ